MVAFASAVALTAVALAGRAAYAGEGIKFEPFSAKAYDRARASGAPFIIEFSAEWCEPCRQMHEQTFKDPTVIREARGVGFLIVDMTSPSRQTELVLQSFRIPGAPTILVYGPDGKERTRRIGFIGAQAFVQMLKDAKAAAVPAEHGI